MTKTPSMIGKAALGLGVGLALALVLGGAAATDALAQAASAPQGGDPRLPAPLRAQRPQASPRGEALDRLVAQKLRARFDAVDRAGTGVVTREQALVSKWPVLAEHFDEIDAQRQGTVRFDDVMRYLRKRRAAR